MRGLDYELQVSTAPWGGAAACSECLCVTLLQGRALQLQGDYSKAQQVHTGARARTHVDHAA